jgi:hypothetical protein
MSKPKFIYKVLPRFSLAAFCIGTMAFCQDNFVLFSVEGRTTYAYSINDNGAVAGYYLDARGVPHGYVREPSGHFISFDPPESSGTQAYSINAHGAITGSFFLRSEDGPGQPQHGFLRDPAGHFAAFDPPQSTYTTPQSINARGEITGYYRPTLTKALTGFLREPDGAFISVDVPGSYITLPQGINSEGDVTGYYFLPGDIDGDFNHGFIRRSGGEYITFMVPGSVTTFAVSINASGAVTGGYTVAGRLFGFVRDREGNFSSFDPFYDVTYANSINDEGAVAGLGFVRAPDGKTTLFNPPAGSLCVAPSGTSPNGPWSTSINNKGVVAGICQASRTQAFIRFP